MLAADMTGLKRQIAKFYHVKFLPVILLSPHVLHVDHADVPPIHAAGVHDNLHNPWLDDDTAMVERTSTCCSTSFGSWVIYNASTHVLHPQLQVR